MSGSPRRAELYELSWRDRSVTRLCSKVQPAKATRSGGSIPKSHPDHFAGELWNPMTVERRGSSQRRCRFKGQARARSELCSDWSIFCACGLHTHENPHRVRGEMIVHYFSRVTSKLSAILSGCHCESNRTLRIFLIRITLRVRLSVSSSLKSTTPSVAPSNLL